MSNGCASTDSNGLRLLSSGSWNGDTTLNIQGGQGMHFQVSNVNVLGTTIEITANTGESHSSIIAPMGSVDLEFAFFFYPEPFGWTFDISTNSDAFIVTWCLFSDWLPGDSSNPPIIATVTGVSPSSASVGDIVTITGSGFSGVTGIGFGVTGASLQSFSDTQLTVTVPNGSGTVDVTVITPAGTSATSSADQFTYLTPVPTVTGINPTSGSAAGGDTVTITGSGFTGATSVGFGNTGAPSLSVDSDSQITTTSPAGSGTVDVTVITPSGTSATSGADQFTYM